MERPEKLLDGELRGTADPAMARFVEMGRSLRLYAPALSAEVDEEFRNAHGRGFATGVHSGDVAFQGGQWVPLPKRPFSDGAVIFRRRGDAWEGFIGEQSIRILQTCDERDAAQWLATFLEIVHAPAADPRRTILLLRGATFVLGEHDANPVAVAGAGARSIRFFNHHTTGRLFCVGVERCTAERRVPTSLLNVIAHEAAHLFHGKLQSAVSRVTAIVDEAMLGSKKAKTEMMTVAREINEGYLPAIVIAGFQKVLIHEPFADHDGFNRGSSRVEMSTYLAGEIVAEAFGRFVICGEAQPQRVSKTTRSLLDHLRGLGMEPVQLIGDSDPVITKMLAPISLEEVLAHAASGRKISL